MHGTTSRSTIAIAPPLVYELTGLSSSPEPIEPHYTEDELRTMLQQNMKSKVMCMYATLIIFFFVGTPLTLFFTVPALHSIYKVLYKGI